MESFGELVCGVNAKRKVDTLLITIYTYCSVDVRAEWFLVISVIF